jgi:cellulose synthase/poly-beta-1,6-N-acetylglucosamine synthase-like glycosyltransferase
MWRAFALAPAAAFAAARFVWFAAFGAAVVLRLFAAAATMMRDRPRTPGWQDDLPVYTLLCPLHREAAVAPRLVAALARLDYPTDRRDVKLIIEADDHETRAALDAIDLPAGFSVVETPPAAPRTKPKALNYALAAARGDFIAVYDAEDYPHPRQIRAALDAFAHDARLGAVQAPLLVDNAASSWIASQFAAEYAVQFLGILPLLAHIGAPLPLGGASNHFRRAALDDAGGWDPFNVTEDADLAYRLARRGWRLGVIDPPTWEEAPARFGPWFRQRTRWIKGHLQTWLVLMRNPFRTARDLGFGGFLWMQLVLGGGLLAALAHLPLLAWLLMAAVAPNIARVTPLDWVLVIAGYVVAALAAAFAAALERNPRLALSVLTMPFYWPLATLAAAVASLEILVRPHYWAKTEHGLTTRETPSPWT